MTASICKGICLIISLIFCISFVKTSAIANYNDGFTMGEAMRIVKNEYETLRMENKKLREELDLYKHADRTGNLEILGTSQIMEIPQSCSDIITPDNEKKDGIYQIYLPESNLDPFHVYCMRDPKNNGSSWTLIQRRQDGSVDFYRGWIAYEQGFGNLSNEHFIGLRKLHALTHSQPHELWISLKDFDDFSRVAKYDSFAIDGPENKYALDVLGQYFGDAGDSLIYHIDRKFTTKDADHDEPSENCAREYHSAGWFNSCQNHNLNGPYKKANPIAVGLGITWNAWHGNSYSLKYAHMAIRPTAS